MQLTCGTYISVLAREANISRFRILLTLFDGIEVLSLTNREIIDEIRGF